MPQYKTYARVISGGQLDARPQNAFQSFTRQLVRGIGLSAHVADDSIATPAAFANFVNRFSECLARWRAAAHNRRAVGAHDDSVKGPSVGGKLQGGGADVRLQLRGPAFVREAEGLGVERAAPDENGQATPGPAVFVQSCVHIDDEALSQSGIPPTDEVAELRWAFKPCAGV